VPHLVPLLIRGINNLSDARYCAGMGADKLTFVLDPALPGALDTKTVKELAGWIAGVELIGEFDQLSAHEINAIAAECSLDAVLLRSSRTANELAEIAPPVYLELDAEAAASAHSLPNSLAGLIIELPETVTPEALAELSEIGASRPLWLGPGLNPDRAHAWATGLNLAGLVFPSGDEVKPGLRDFDQLEAVFEALETE
jgi:phosphoribosylanthranilate isomerase